MLNNNRETTKYSNCSFGCDSWPSPIAYLHLSRGTISILLTDLNRYNNLGYSRITKEAEAGTVKDMPSNYLPSKYS